MLCLAAYDAEHLLGQPKSITGRPLEETERIIFKIFSF